MVVHSLVLLASTGLLNLPSVFTVRSSSAAYSSRAVRLIGRSQKWVSDIQRFVFGAWIAKRQIKPGEARVERCRRAVLRRINGLIHVGANTGQERDKSNAPALPRYLPPQSIFEAILMMVYIFALSRTRNHDFEAFLNFKRNEDYRVVLEHVSYEQGREYLVTKIRRIRMACGPHHVGTW
jgi:hypothetical protein